MLTASSRFWLRIGSVGRFALAGAVGVLGLLMAHYPMIFSGFARIQTDLGDSRLIHYLLEHGYRWILRAPTHLDFWSPPYFFPEKNTAAYSDVLLSVGPVYWLWRRLGASPDSAFGLWMLSMSALNYAAGLLLFRRGLGFGVAAGSAGAAMVAFGAPRLNEMGHQQLLPFFYPLLTLYGLARLFGDSSLGLRPRAGYWLLAMAGALGQLYAAVYVGWFLIVAIGLAAVTALLMPSCQGRFLRVMRRDAGLALAATAGGALLLQPFLSHYLLAAREVRSQYMPTLRALHPAVTSWLDVSAQNWLWGWTVRPGWAGELAYVESAHHLGIGFLTPIACAAGLLLRWKWPVCRIAAAVAFTMWLATTYMPGDTLALLAAIVSWYCALGLFQQVDRPTYRAIGLTVVVGLLLLTPFPNTYMIMLGLITIVLCLLEIRRTRGRPRPLLVSGIAIVLISQKFFTPGAVLNGALVIAPVFGLMAFLAWPRRWDVAFAGVVLLMAFVIVITFLDGPRLPIGAASAAPVALILGSSRGYRPPAWLLVRVMVIALAIVRLFYHQDSLWLGYSEMIPGAVAIRALGRVVLILLVPAALGLASLVEFVDERRFGIAGWVILLVCLAEQGIKTETFDAAANRASIERLASRIDRNMAAFYYHPVDGLPFYRHHLDAMWASLATGVPTINGYSGHAPRSWHNFFRADFDPRIDARRVLVGWERSHGLSPDRVQWIGPERERTSQDH